MPYPSGKSAFYKGKPQIIWISFGPSVLWQHQWRPTVVLVVAMCEYVSLKARGRSLRGHGGSSQGDRGGSSEGTGARARRTTATAAGALHPLS